MTFNNCCTTIHLADCRLLPGSTGDTVTSVLEFVLDATGFDAFFGHLSHGVSGSPLVEPSEPVDAIADETQTGAVVLATLRVRRRMRVKILDALTAIAL